MCVNPRVFTFVSRGESALRLAMSKRHLEVVDLLVNNPDIRLKEGKWLCGSSRSGVERLPI